MRCPPLVPWLRPAEMACALVVAAGTLEAGGGVARAAESTDVIDAFDKGDPIDIDLGVSFFRTLYRAKIVREGCIERRDADGDGSLIPCTAASSDSRITTYNDLRWDRVDAGVEIAPRIGLAPDLNLLVKIPIYLESTRRLTPNSAAPCGSRIGGACMPINPTSLERDGLLNDETTGGTGRLDGGEATKERSGLGDLFVGLELGLFNQDRDPSKSFWTIGFGSTLPSGTVARVDNKGMGRGTFKLAGWMNFSKRFAYLEPYSGLRYEAEFPIRDSVFQDTHFPGSGQRTWSPGMMGAVAWGIEIVPIENKENGLKLSFDVGLRISYTSEGRDYSELFDFIGEKDPCEIPALAGPYTRAGEGDLYDGSIHAARDADQNCADAPVDHDADPATPDVMVPSIPFDGVTDVEQHLAWEGHFTLNLHVPLAPPHVTAYIGVTALFRTVQEHFLTFGDAGIDSGNRKIDGNDGVVDECTPAMYDNGSGVYECNPNFQPVFDLPGRRFKIEENSVFTLMGTAVLKF
jgi:hypothetical protein